MLFWRKKPEIRAAVDVGSHSIKAAVFELERGVRGEKGENGAKSPALRASPLEKGEEIPPISPLEKGELGIKVIQKKVIPLPARENVERAALLLRELLFGVVKNIERVPGRITIGLGPETGRASLLTWTARPSGKITRVTRDLARNYFENLAEQYRDSGQAFIAYPAGVFVNRYPVRLGSGGVSSARVQELQFRVFMLTVPARAGAILADARRALGGMPIEFVPLAASLGEAFLSRTGVEAALLIDIGGENTSLTLLKDGQLAEFTSFPHGARHFARAFARETGVTWREAEDAARHIAEKALLKEGSVSVSEQAAWKKDFLEALEEFYPVGPLPPDVFVFGGGAYFKGIVDMLTQENWIDRHSHVRSPTVRVMRAENFFEGNTLGGALAGPGEVGLASLLLYSRRHEALL